MRKIAVLILTSGLFLWAGAQVLNRKQFMHRVDSMILADSLQAIKQSVDAEETGGTPRKGLREEIVKYAREYMGLRYRRGGASTRGFDCSGFTSHVFGRFGIRLPHTSAGQSFYGIEVPRDKLRKGDLVFFKGANLRRKGIGHVGIIISEKGEEPRFIHSSTSGGIKIDQLNSYYYRLRYVKARRVLLE